MLVGQHDLGVSSFGEEDVIVPCLLNLVPFKKIKSNFFCLFFKFKGPKRASPQSFHENKNKTRHKQQE